MERPLSQSNPNLMRWITSTLGRALMHVRFTVVLLEEEKASSPARYSFLLEKLHTPYAGEASILIWV